MFSDFLKSALKNKIFWYLVSRYLTFGIQFITSIYIAVKLGAYYFGIWSFFLLLINIGTQVNWGIGNAINILLVQNREDDSKCKTYILNSLVLTGAISILPLMILLIDRIFRIPILEKYNLGNLIYVAAVIVILNYIIGFFSNVFRVKNRILEIAISQSLPPFLLLAVMFFAKGETLLILLASAYMIAYLGSAVLFLRGGYIDFQVRIQKNVMREIFYKGIFLFLYNACFMFILLSSKFLISRYYSVKEFGYFAFAFSLAWAALLMVDSFSFLIFPKMIDLLKGKENKVILPKIEFMHKQYVTCVHLLFYLAIPGCWVLLHFIPKYQAAFPAFVVVVLTIMIYTQCFGYNTYMLAQNKEKIIALFAFGTVILNIGMMLFFIKVYNVPFSKAMLGTVIAYIPYTLAVGLYARKYLQGAILLPDAFFIFNVRKMLPYLIALMLLLCGSVQITWIPFMLFSLLNIRSILDCFQKILQITNNANIMDLKVR